MSNLDLNLNNEFSGKKIIVTGASRGLGAQTCKVLAKRGAQIVMFSRSKNEMENLRNRMHNSSKHISIKVDFLDNNSLNKAFKKAIDFLKKIDIIIHVAGGGFGLKDPLIKNDDLRTLLQVNFVAAAELNRLAVKTKRKDGDLRLIHVGSITSSEAVGSVGYNVAKAALASYVKSLGRELYNKKTVVTGILPGGFISPGNAMDRLKKKNIKDYRKFVKTRLPRKKMGEVEEILPMLLFLCSKHASMMGGCLVPIDAGESKAYQI